MGILTITDESIISIARSLTTTKVGEETIIFDDESGTYVSLSEIGTVIFEGLTEAQTVAALIKHLMDTYDVDRNTCRKDVLSFLNDMVKANLISAT